MNDGKIDSVYHVVTEHVFYDVQATVMTLVWGVPDLSLPTLSMLAYVLVDGKRQVVD